MPTYKAYLVKTNYSLIIPSSLMTTYYLKEKNFQNTFNALNADYYLEFITVLEIISEACSKNTNSHF